MHKPGFGGFGAMSAAFKVIRFLLAGCTFSIVLSPYSPPALLPQLSQPLPVPAPGPQYSSPMQNAQYVSKAATIVVRYGPDLSDQDISALKFTIRGSQSGLHEGQTILADDHKTVIFKPDDAFTPGEKVSVNINTLYLNAQTGYPPISYAFTVATNQQPGSPGSSLLSDPPVPASAPRSAFPNFLTVPQDIPHYTVSKTSSSDGGGDIFVAPFYWTESKVGSYLLILNQQGELVYYQSVADTLDAWDFKEQPNGLLSYYDQKDATFYLMDSHYHVVDTFQAGDGYTADLHDFQMLANGNALLMAYDAESVDMSGVILGGSKGAMVTGLVIQELDRSKNVIFEWRSWDHFPLRDSFSDLTAQNIDLVHGNALAVSTDGNLLLSSRNLSEITKIDLQTGNVIWRLGGKGNTFTFVNGQPFAYQHDVRQLPNGDITLFDNHGTPQNPAPSRGIEYKLDETNRIVTEVWAFAPTPAVFASYMGNTQRLSNGNTFLSWGAPYTKQGYAYLSMTEVTPDDRTVFELTFDQPYVSYRAFLFPWRGFPDTAPALAYKVSGGTITLGYSWNGATEVTAYRVYGGSAPNSLDLIEEKGKADFETQSQVIDPPADICYFQVAALESRGNELARSKIISTDEEHCPALP